MHNITKRIWIGRLMLAGVVIAIMGVLAYLFITSTNDSRSKATTSIQKQKTLFSEKDAVTLVKNAYSTYVKTAYDEQKPNPATALDVFKQSVEPERRSTLGNNVPKGKDPVLCTNGKPEELSYTKPTLVKDTVLITVVSAMEEGTVQAVVTVERGQNKITEVACGN